MTDPQVVLEVRCHTCGGLRGCVVVRDGVRYWALPPHRRQMRTAPESAFIKESAGKAAAYETYPGGVGEVIDGTVTWTLEDGTTVDEQWRPTVYLGGCKCGLGRQVEFDELQRWLRDGRRVVKV